MIFDPKVFASAKADLNRTSNYAVRVSSFDQDLFTLMFSNHECIVVDTLRLAEAFAQSIGADPLQIKVEYCRLGEGEPPGPLHTFHGVVQFYSAEQRAAYERAYTAAVPPAPPATMAMEDVLLALGARDRYWDSQPAPDLGSAGLKTH